MSEAKIAAVSSRFILKPYYFLCLSLLSISHKGFDNITSVVVAVLVCLCSGNSDDKIVFGHCVTAFQTEFMVLKSGQGLAKKAFIG